MIEAKQLLEYQQNGAICLKNVFSQETITDLLKGIEKNLANPSPNACIYSQSQNPFVFKDDYCNWQQIKEYRAFVSSKVCVDLAKFFMQENAARFYHEHVFFKSRHAKERTPWHHDYTYYEVNCQKGLSFWVPLDPVLEEDAIAFLLGSHLWGKLFRPQKFLTAKDYPLSEASTLPLPDIDATPQIYPLKKWSVVPGDVIIFHMKTIHGQPFDQKPATSNRRTFVARWLSAGATYQKRDWQGSPSFESLKLENGISLPEDYFPIFH